ncbi:zinc finger protein 502-like isoform X2 [Pectinophora gossypiella]|uniref:zinc finger protein 502-like isoform X2 n=1 Tax=Pectinophora gossypiella TaxID=13191 RepID=UPI00214F5BC7|nr:zinc finger protein 502-like isoform X2 [Pectinophora gossypiella]XP_049883315.1 zinc finger protein 502-like isoform X2 [Pectinophora gossypiella]
MDEENLKSWAAQPDVCRCCLSSSGTWDLTALYVTNLGIKEIFADILQECYGITLSYLSEWGPSHLICNLCVGHLRDASAFRKRVLKAEECFVEYFTKKQSQTTVKLELGNDSECCNDHLELEDTSVVEENHSILKTETDPQQEQTIKPENENCIGKSKKALKSRRKKKEDSDYDSDVPIAELTKRKQHPDNIEENLQCEIILKDSESAVKDIKHKGPQLVVPKVCIKQISERKRVMLTCEIVLSDTTACPFRHHKSWFKCFFCTEEFMDIISLRSHQAGTHQDIEAELRKMKRYPRSLQIEISNLECRHCHVSLTDVDTMRRHFESVHNKTIYNECIADYKINCSPYTCHLCKQEFHVFRTLTTHLNEHYANCICDVCGRSFINSKRLKVHKRTHENGNFPCTECGKILKTKTSRSNHVESAHSKRVVKCQICFKPMKHYNDRIKHMSEVHNITHMFKCNICSKEYNIKHYLATHMRQTHGNKNKKCLECGMAFITNHGLKKHMSKHTGVKPHKCGVCGKGYARSYTLREHMRAHEGDRRFLTE